ncbi:uncharacterized protein EI97DRAFT_187478 [Westerdykella ornata]|uniref:ABM domain-containing protein n=1 Tax=Westerdykella ornata TaxID=318751 RepID=A0A6A6JVG5_WESOR|nr:uncharacterized protein EI97DRAFT_187478 [Westerdykella ornata]KAF2279808.1 hypothetical protein EI97DRAFT_187478 [Westerdykella ornata]
MVVTELALLRLLPPTTVGDAALQSKLANAKTVMENFTKRRFYFAQQVEDPTLVYVIGEWDSLTQHMDEFIPSASNQALLESLKDELTVEWLIHIHAPHAELPLPKPGTPTSTNVLSIERHFVKDGEKSFFARVFEEEKHHLQEYVTEGRIGGGWRADPQDGKEEFVLLCPWVDVEQHTGFARIEGSMEYGRIREVVSDLEIRHARIIDL